MYHRTLLSKPGVDRAEVYRYDLETGEIKQWSAFTKSNHNFRDHFTDWERGWSTLTRVKPGRFSVNAWTSYSFDPVVDDNLTIIGHYGWAKGNRIFVPENSRRVGKGELAVELGLQHIVDMDVPVLIRDGAQGGGKGTEPWSTDEQLYRVLTDPHGRVLLYTGYDVVGLQSAEEALLVVGLVYGLANIAARGIGAGIRALARKAEKSATKGPARPPLPRGTITGNPPQVNLGPVFGPGTLKAFVSVDGGEVTYRVTMVFLKGLPPNATARLAHREMILRSAHLAQQNGKKVFKLRGGNVQDDFITHADKLARELGVAKSGTKLGDDYEVTLDVAKVLSSQ
jgi:hypothetical protein